MATKPYTFSNLHLSGLIDTLKEQHSNSMKASDNDRDAPLAVDSEKMDFARRFLNAICDGTIEADDAGLATEGTKTEAEIHGTGGRPVKDATPTTSSEEVARGDSTRRASDSRRLAFDKRGNLRHSASAIFASDNATRYAAPNTIDSIFGARDDGNSSEHSVDTIFAKG